MKSISILATVAVALLAGFLLDTVAGECTCTQYTCTTNVCETVPGCKKPRPWVVGQGFIEDSIGGTMYSIQVGSKLTRAQSLKACTDEGFTGLASFTTEAQRQKLDQMLTTAGYKSAEASGNQFWVSYNKIGSTEWSWAPSGSTAFQAAWWAPENPNNADADCTTLTSAVNLNDAKCEAYNLYRICQAPLCSV